MLMTEGGLNLRPAPDDKQEQPATPATQAVTLSPPARQKRKYTRHKPFAARKRRTIAAAAAPAPVVRERPVSEDRVIMMLGPELFDALRDRFEMPPAKVLEFRVGANH